MVFVCDKVENIVGKRKIADNQHFFFPTMFSKSFLYRVLKLMIKW